MAMGKLKSADTVVEASIRESDPVAKGLFTVARPEVVKNHKTGRYDPVVDEEPADGPMVIVEGRVKRAGRPRKGDPLVQVHPADLPSVASMLPEANMDRLTSPVGPVRRKPMAVLLREAARYTTLRFMPVAMSMLEDPNTSPSVKVKLFDTMARIALSEGKGSGRGGGGKYDPQTVTQTAVIALPVRVAASLVLPDGGQSVDVATIAPSPMDAIQALAMARLKESHGA